VCWNILNLPGTIKRRRIIQKNRKVSDQELFNSGLIDREIFSDVYIPDYNITTENNYIDDKIGYNLDLTTGSCQLGYGWYPLEPVQLGDKKVGRWQQREATFYIKKGHHNKLILEYFAPVEAIGDDIKFEISISNIYHGVKIYSDFKLDSNLPQILSIDIKPLNDGILKVSSYMHNMWKPKDIFGNEDPRELGGMLLNARMSID